MANPLSASEKAKVVRVIEAGGTVDAALWARVGQKERP